ncbi:MAG: hypothetical protein KDC35_12360 [Acidobacteria bacterium]|nr:hypothetical protein [Acidobacteriota bacterium]
MWVLVVAVFAFGGGEEAVKDSCIACHQSNDFLVTNKKLYTYFQDWRASVHGQEDIGCMDCHGGDNKTMDKDQAHGKDMETGTKASAVNFENIPKTCGHCHDDQLNAYVQSEHFQHLKKEEDEGRGPNCVTCHGSLNSRKLNVNTVARVCEQCHNSETDNHPQIPDQATALLNDFNTINGYRRFIMRRGEDERAFVSILDKDLAALSIDWHLFDLDRIGMQTEKIMKTTKEKRSAILNKDKD